MFVLLLATPLLLALLLVVDTKRPALFWRPTTAIRFLLPGRERELPVVAWSGCRDGGILLCKVGLADYYTHQESESNKALGLSPSTKNNAPSFGVLPGLVIPMIA